MGMASRVNSCKSLTGLEEKSWSQMKRPAGGSNATASLRPGWLNHNTIHAILEATCITYSSAMDLCFPMFMYDLTKLCVGEEFES